MNNWNTTLTEKLQKYQHYYPENMIKMSVSQVKKYYLLIKEKNKVILLILLQEKLCENKQKQLKIKEKDKQK